MAEPAPQPVPERADRATGPLEYALIAALFAAFVMAARFRAFGLDFFTFILLVGTLGAAVLVTLHGHRERGWTLSRTAWGWLIAWLLALFVNVQAAVSSETSFHFSLFLVVPVAGFLIAVTLLRTDRGLALIAAVLVGLTSLSVIAAVIQNATGSHRSAGLFSDANNLGTFCYVLWLATFGALCGAADQLDRRRWLLGAAILLVMSLGVFVSRSRAGFLILVAGALFMALAALPDRKRWPVIALGLGTIALAWMLGNLHSGGSVGTRLAATSLQSATFSARWAMIEGALRIYVEYPLTGSGLGSFKLLYPMFRPVTDQTTGAYFVHNDYLQVLAEGGPLLLLLALVPVGVLAFVGLRLALSCVFERVRPRHWLALGIAAGLGGAALHMTVNFLVYLPIGGLLIGVMAGALLVLGRESEPRRRTLTGRWPLVVGLLAYLPVMALLAVDGLMLGVLQDQLGFPGAQRYKGAPERQYEGCRLITTLNPSRSLPWLCQAMLAEHFRERGENEDYWRLTARAAFQRAIATDPFNPLVFLRYAAWLRAHGGDDDRRLELLLRALVLDPVSPPSVQALLDEYSRRGEPESRYGLLRNIVWPRAELAYRVSGDTALGWIDELAASARARGEDEFAAEVERRRERVAAIRRHKGRDHLL